MKIWKWTKLWCSSGISSYFFSEFPMFCFVVIFFCCRRHLIVARLPLFIIPPLLRLIYEPVRLVCALADPLPPSHATFKCKTSLSSTQCSSHFHIGYLLVFNSCHFHIIFTSKQLLCVFPYFLINDGNGNTARTVAAHNDSLLYCHCHRFRNDVRAYMYCTIRLQMPFSSIFSSSLFIQLLCLSHMHTVSAWLALTLFYK